MRTAFAILAVAVASLSFPVAKAEAGFFTQVVKGNISNAARRLNDKFDRDGSVTTRRTFCALKRAAGRSCE